MIDNGKAKILEVNRSLVIELPSKKSPFLVFFAPFWLFIWCFSIFFGFSFLSSNSIYVNDGYDSFLVIWSVFWIIGGLIVLLGTLWIFFGKEKIQLNSNESFFFKTLFGLGIKKKFETKELKNFRFQYVNENIIGAKKLTHWGLGTGKIKFDYGFKTFSFALGLDDPEAKFIAEKLQNFIAIN